MQVWQIVQRNDRHPGGQTVAAAAGEHLGERGDVRGGGLEVGATGQDLFESELLAVSEVVGMVQHPQGDVPNFRDLRSGRWRGTDLTEWTEVVADGGVAAAIAEGPNLLIEGECCVSVVPSRVQVLGKLVQHGAPARPPAVWPAVRRLLSAR